MVVDTPSNHIQAAPEPTTTRPDLVVPKVATDVYTPSPLVRYGRMALIALVCVVLMVGVCQHNAGTPRNPMTSRQADRMIRKHLPLGTRWNQVEYWLTSDGIKNAGGGQPPYTSQETPGLWVPGVRVGPIYRIVKVSYHDAERFPEQTDLYVELYFDDKDALIGHHVNVFVYSL